MVDLVPLDISVHKEDFLLLNCETMRWHFDEFLERYQIDLYSVVGKTPQEMAESSIETYRGLKPPEGIFYLAYIENKIAGMGAIRKLDNELGEIKRMWNRPQFRRRGVGRLIVNSLLEKGKEFGCTWFGLNTPKFSIAHHLYKSVGFEFVDVFPAVDIGNKLRPYYLFMEKKQ
jgi:GNAT superfamily N-acetyltransferase